MLQRGQLNNRSLTIRIHNEFSKHICPGKFSRETATWYEIIVGQMINGRRYYENSDYVEYSLCLGQSSVLYHIVFACPCLPSLPSSQSVWFTKAHANTVTSFKMLDGRQRRNRWQRLKMNVELGRSCFHFIRWERFVYYVFISKCLLSAVAKLPARQRPCLQGAKSIMNNSH